VNQCKSIRPFLKQHPVPADSISIGISYARKKPEDIFSAYFSGNKVVILFDENGKSLKETYSNYLVTDGKPLEECEKVVEILK